MPDPPGMRRYRRRLVDVDAVQVTSANMDDVRRWVDGQVIDSGPVRMLLVPTTDGNEAAYPGDWVVRGVAGEFYLVRGQVFDKLYTEAGTR